ncbi:MAG: MbnP family protein [Ferruginibacter sp.]
MRIKIKNFLLLIAVVSVTISVLAQSNTGNITIHFQYRANNQSMVLVDSVYKNIFGESYQPTRLKYYISNIELRQSPSKNKYKSSVYLIDAAAEQNLYLSLQPGIYHTLAFSIGVDSSLNGSGAQSGALDPINGMFWTWNTGYIYFKLEGYSADSPADLQKIVYHIGGYTGLNKANRNVELTLAEPLQVVVGKAFQLNITVDLDKFWMGKSMTSIAANALIMSPGVLAAAAADNIPAMFSISSIE